MTNGTSRAIGLVAALAISCRAPAPPVAPVPVPPFRDAELPPPAPEVPSPVKVALPAPSVEPASPEPVARGKCQAPAPPRGHGGQARRIAVGFFHTCMLRSDGRVTCWGSNGQGQLGDGTTEPSPVPVFVTGLDDAVEVWTFGYRSCARRKGGETMCWGLALDATGGGPIDLVPCFAAAAPEPRIDVPPGAVEAVAAADHACARFPDGHVECQGENHWGALGDGTNQSSSRFVRAKGIANAVELSVSGHSCARLANGRVMCWGANATGQLGDGTTSVQFSPVPVKGLTDVTEIAAGSSHTCARLAGERVACWGYNASGQLGNGSTQSSSVPVQVLPPVQRKDPLRVPKAAP